MVIKKQHTIPIHLEILGYIENVCKNSPPEAFVFVNKNTGSYYRETTLGRIWKNSLKKAGLRYIKLYDAARHSFASQLVNSGVHLNIISKLLGHSNIKMTQRYAHENIQSLKTATEKVSISTVPRGQNDEKRSLKIKLLHQQTEGSNPFGPTRKN